MQRHLHATLLLTLTLLLTACGGSDESAPASTSTTGSSETLTIAVVPKGTTHEHWKAVHYGALKAAEELGVEIIWQGPQSEDQRNQQIDLVKNLIAQQVDAIVLAPLDSVALVNPVKEAAAAGIPVVIFDSGIEAERGTDYIAFVSTDNYEGGRKAGQRMAELRESGDDLILLRYAPNSASTERREQGFLDVVNEAGLNVVSDDQFAGATVNTALNKSQAMLISYLDGDSLSVDAIHTPNESSTYGMLRALERADLAGKVTFVGFDISPPLIEALQAGKIHGLVAQDPVNMGYQGVMTAVKHLRGEPYEDFIDTGSTMITADNINEPRIQQHVNRPQQ